MRSHRFYAAIDLKVDQILRLPKETAHHCLQVLRYRVGNELILFNGDGFDYAATIHEIEGKHCEVKITEQFSLQNESPLKIHLYQGIARGEKMDLIIQKSVELGVSEITPVFSERCNVKLDGKRLLKKQQHWQNIAVSASEQSGRAAIPQVNNAVHINQLAPSLSSESSESLNLFLEPNSNQRLADCRPDKSVNLFIGPEGGFSKSDLQQFEKLEFVGSRIGPRILRTETAGLCAIAILQSHFGDL